VYWLTVTGLVLFTVADGVLVVVLFDKYGEPYAQVLQHSLAVLSHIRLRT
jgi:hypothetical protein